MIHRTVLTPLRIVVLMIQIVVGLNAKQIQRNPAVTQTQVPNTVNKAAVQGRTFDGIPQQPPGPSIQLLADRTSALVGEVVTFSLEPARVVSSRYVFTFDFGDGNKVELPADKSSIEHTYNVPGTVPVSVTFSLRPPAEDFGSNPVIGNGLTVQVDPVSLTASPPNPAVGQTVTFETPFRNSKPDIRYRFIAGDEADPASVSVIAEPRATHAYTRSETFMARLEIGRLEAEQFIAFATATAQVVVSPAPIAELTSSPSNPGVGETVSFTITYPPDRTDLRFRVDFGDGSPQSDWDTSPTALHAYRPAGTYIAHGEVARVVNGAIVPIASSATISIGILAPSPVWPWLLLIVAGATALAVNKYRKTMLAPRPILEAHPDTKNSNPDIDRIPIDVQVRLVHGVPDGQFELQTDGHNLIPSGRKRHG